MRPEPECMVRRIRTLIVLVSLSAQTVLAGSQGCPSSSLITVLAENFDFVTPPALPVGWAATNGIDPDGILWQSSSRGLPAPPADSLPNAVWVNGPAVVSDKYL